MDSGEKELRKVFEEVITKNVKTAVDFSNKTREIVREFEKRIELLENSIAQQNEMINTLRLQLVNVQAKVYSGGT